MSEKLHPRLIYKTDPQPIDSCVIERGNVRITVLTDRLFRIETKPKKGASSMRRLRLSGSESWIPLYLP